MQIPYSRTLKLGTEVSAPLNCGNGAKDGSPFLSAHTPLAVAAGRGERIAPPSFQRQP